MNTKEWKRNELFHLLMEKFNLKINEQTFGITGTGLDDESAFWNQPEESGFSLDDPDDAPKAAEFTKALGDLEAPEEFEPGKDSYVAKAPSPAKATKVDVPKPKKDGRGSGGLTWDSNLNQGMSFKSDDKNFDKEFKNFKKAISSKESGHLGYKALGIPVHEYGYDGDRARGKYQIMGKNWKKWAKEAGMPESAWDPDTGMTPENQEYVASFKFRQYYNQFDGDWRKVAIAWYSGPAGMEKKVNNYKKVYHKGHDKPFPSIAEYGDDIVSRMKDASIA